MRLASASPRALAPAKDQAGLAPDKKHLVSDENRLAFAKKQHSRGLSGGAPCLTCGSQPGEQVGEPDLETPHLLSSEFQGEGRAVQR